MPRAAAFVPKSEKALAEERKQIQEYKSLEKDVQDKVTGTAIYRPGRALPLTSDDQDTGQGLLQHDPAAHL